MRVPWRLFLSHAQPQQDGCTQAAHPMQQRKQGATIFHMQVAPSRAFSGKVDFLLPFGAKPPFFRRKRTINVPFPIVDNPVGRVAPFPVKIRVAPGCTRKRLQILLASA
ncbi:hypothetical protein [Pseudomonas sp. Teo4]|uniref:hypothetical protein n=1 Tax=Pseudomonas sp. Teo4 TaxID=3064528 RepID=UPI002ACB0795|nr:hypothetical protein [Pseudomonas sp. Teo4]